MTSVARLLCQCLDKLLSSRSPQGNHKCGMDQKATEGKALPSAQWISVGSWGTKECSGTCTQGSDLSGSQTWYFGGKEKGFYESCKFQIKPVNN